MFREIYIILLVLITLIFLYFYCVYKKDYDDEMVRISELEKKKLEQEQRIIRTRAATTQCPYIETTNPKKCYIESGYKCKWNEDAQRCNII